jgi:hypothetical protein
MSPRRPLLDHPACWSSLTDLEAEVELENSLVALVLEVSTTTHYAHPGRTHRILDNTLQKTVLLHLVGVLHTAKVVHGRHGVCG